jgi:hypothetical protein
MQVPGSVVVLSEGHEGADQKSRRITTCPCIVLEVNENRKRAMARKASRALGGSLAR